MKTIVDLHMHSYYSRATSKALDTDGIAKFSAIKGVDLVATGDITHPKWLAECEAKLSDDGSGFLTLRNNASPTRFVLCGEVSSIYKKEGKTRRVHTLFAVSSFAVAKKVQKTLLGRGINIAYDGRPIIGMDVQELAKIYLDADPRALIIPAHIWTPWFSLFGSKTGFNSIEECFGEMSKYVYAVETGLSSDPAMNWRLSDLNDVMILSNSDAHSPEKIGREANVFSLPQQTYDALHASIRENKNLDYTIEFFPEEGKYHLDGHRVCGVRLTPSETKKRKGICPKCGLPVVVGVMNRVEELANQAPDEKERVPYKSIVPLPEIIASAFGVGVKSKKVQAEYLKLIEGLGNEFHILLDASPEAIRQAAHSLVAEGIMRVRDGNIHIDPGYDGEFGVVQVFTEAERRQHALQQHRLF